MLAVTETSALSLSSWSDDGEACRVQSCSLRVTQPAGGGGWNLSNTEQDICKMHGISCMQDIRMTFDPVGIFFCQGLFLVQYVV